MPTSKVYGTPGPNNEKIGGVPIMHYFDFMSRGRGQAVRLLWEDAGIAYEDVRYTFDEYPSYKADKISALNPAATIPVVELDGRILTQSYAMLRHFSRLLDGVYDGKTEAEKYFTDQICDMVIDWRTLFVTAFLSPEKETAYPKHCSTTRANFLKAITQHFQGSDLAQRGPFVIGDTFTYADIVLYQICHDEELTRNGRKGLQDYPRLVEFVDAVEARPNVKAFLESERYLG
ncbi:glutathione S-transferase-like protein [Dothidotthia symphoricarpi CBS 119687]|uniref:Glutathione S-transferase-like protein n=1 Tax=Dothidotthia symphoricarpi CBS 119687 TaxID=1392245 RepID=A0A6A6AMH6_9PLEO|nr:glutathione S-transferase-like protein [Dothidotthia symphoricarpi CBS 119687]KAF2131681.1 glutathione S-transferase-like protein [Dothidotthia symphoricarpi CBS 119687]